MMQDYYIMLQIVETTF